MNNSRKFEKNQTIYVIGCWGTSNGTRSIVDEAVIVDVDEEKEMIVAVLFGDVYERYRFEDYGQLIFMESDDAWDKESKIPRPRSDIYQIIKNRVYKKKAVCIYCDYHEDYVKLYMGVNRGKAIPIKEVGVSVFLNEEDARKALQAKSKVNLSTANFSDAKVWAQALEEDPKLKELAIKANVVDNPKRAQELHNAFGINCGADVCKNEAEKELCEYMFIL